MHTVQLTNERNMLRIIIISLIFSCLLNQLVVVCLKSHPTQSISRFDRQKRQLFSTGTNIVKLTLGFGFPVDLADAVNYRTLVWGWNFQGQYAVNPAPTSKRSLHKRMLHYSKHKTCCNDETRQMFYNALEIMMLRKGVNGKECLLRAICENAQTAIKVTGIFHEILNLFLNPTENENDTDYMDAKQAGAIGADCLHLYKNCPRGHGFLDSMSQFMR